MRYVLKAQYLGSRERTAQSNGRKYYSITVLQGDQTQSLAVNEELYKQASDFNKLDEKWFYVAPSVRTGGPSGAFLNCYCSGWCDVGTLEDYEDL